MNRSLIDVPEAEYQKLFDDSEMTLNRSPPSVNQLLLEYRELACEKDRCKTRLEHETKVVEDLRSELDHSLIILGKKESCEELYRKIEELDSIKKTRQELVDAIEGMEEHLACLDKELEAQMESMKKEAHQAILLEKKEFLRQMDELEEQRRNETQKLRDEIRKKENRLKMARQKAIVEHNKRKEELRKALTNKLKATGLHVECRSIELDLKKQIAALEKEVPLLIESKSGKCSRMQSAAIIPGGKRIDTPRPIKQTGNKLPLHVVTSATPSVPHSTSSVTNPAGPVRKRKLFSVNSDFMDF